MVLVGDDEFSQTGEFRLEGDETHILAPTLRLEEYRRNGGRECAVLFCYSPDEDCSTFTASMWYHCVLDTKNGSRPWRIDCPINEDERIEILSGQRYKIDSAERNAFYGQKNNMVPFMWAPFQR